MYKNTENKELDVRPYIPIKRHEMLLKLFSELESGQSFVFINDHDPKPLYYEFRSIYGDVVGWEYLQRDPIVWKVKVIRTEITKERDFEGASTIIDLRKTDSKDWKYAVFHRYGMMLKGDTMEIIAKEEPEEIKRIFERKFGDKHIWSLKKDENEEFIVHVTKISEGGIEAADISVVASFDVRPYPPAKRHDMVFDAFDNLNPGEAFVFINDHDPKPLYYQMEAENQIPFKWEYLSTMPEEWTVKVMKLNENE